MVSYLAPPRLAVRPSRRRVRRDRSRGRGSDDARDSRPTKRTTCALARLTSTRRTRRRRRSCTAPAMQYRAVIDDNAIGGTSLHYWRSTATEPLGLQCGARQTAIRASRIPKGRRWRLPFGYDELAPYTKFRVRSRRLRAGRNHNGRSIRGAPIEGPASAITDAAPR